jgi:GNAT superfamily N-acetyltransferase
MSSSFRIRLARPDEIARLREIEDKAGEMFSGLGLNDDTLDSSFPIDDLIRLVGMQQTWVACTEDDRPVGMVFASMREGAVYVEELDVMLEFGRRGLGSRLLNCVCDWAREQRCAGVTLSTFRDVPWNGPFYATAGFRELPEPECSAAIREILADEAARGLPSDARLAMRLTLPR